MAQDLTYQEERQLNDLLESTFRGWDVHDLEILDRAWLRMGKVKYSMLIHLPVDRVLKQMKGIQTGESVNRPSEQTQEDFPVTQDPEDLICCCGSELNGSHDHNSCGPPIPRFTTE
jgi:hypothetical protein